MELQMTASEFLNEDGHGQNIDLLEDEAAKLVNIKLAFLDALADARKLVSDDDCGITCEQWFDDLLHGERTRLSEELGYEIDYPISKAQQVWLESQRRKQ